MDATTTYTLADYSEQTYISPLAIGWHTSQDDDGLLKLAHLSGCFQLEPGYALDVDGFDPSSDWDAWPCCDCIPDHQPSRLGDRYDDAEFAVRRGDGPAKSSAAQPNNQYPGECSKCGARVEAMQGLRNKIDGRWMVDHIGPCPDAEPKAAAPAAGCTDRQAGFIAKLAEERNVDVDPSWLVSKSTASAAIESLLTQPKATERAPEAKEDGYQPAKGDVHVIDGVYYRVHRSQGGGFHYGAVWNGDKFVGPRFDDRAKGLLKRISGDTLATADQAAAFGRMHHRCCFCSTAIDTPESEAVGYGPVCARARSLPWG